MPPKDKYTDPKLRDAIKEEVQQGDKGGRPGQWSARKAQMMASEYKKRGGEYNTAKSQQDESQKHLSKWTDEEWQTKEGSGNAKQEDGTEKRYLPKKAWEHMTEEEKDQTDAKKQKGSKEGKQFVGNTRKAKESRQKASEDKDEKYEGKRVRRWEQGDGDDDDDDAAAADGEEEEYMEDDEDAEEDDEAGNVEDDGDDASGGDDQDNEEDNGGEGEEEAGDQQNTKPGQKRKPANQCNGSAKSQKTNPGNGQSKSSGKSASEEEYGSPGSAERLPDKGQIVYWKFLPGFVSGEVMEVVTGEEEVEGQGKVKGSEKHPRVVIKTSSTGKVVVHKANACYF